MTRLLSLGMAVTAYAQMLEQDPSVSQSAVEAWKRVPIAGPITGRMFAWLDVLTGRHLHRTGPGHSHAVDIEALDRVAMWEVAVASREVVRWEVVRWEVVRWEAAAASREVAM